mgnify:CR=1 FL=1
MASPLRHVKKKALRDLNHRIEQVRLRMHNKKAKRDIPRLQAELNALYKQKDQVMRNNLQGTPAATKAAARHPPAPRLCAKCGERLGRGYHICKAMPGNA